MYVATMAPGVTFWDAGEFIAAAHGFGIPHPPGTPLFIALGHAWIMLLHPLMGDARAMNLLSAVATALAALGSARLVARETRSAWGAVVGALCAGLMTSVWANATEAEVYALALLHAVAMLLAARRASDDDRWLIVTAFLIALAPAVHLSALLAAPAAAMLAARDERLELRLDRMVLLGGAMIAAAGVGRISLALVGAGMTLVLASALVNRRGAYRWRLAAQAVLACAVATTALVIMLVRARHDPPLNQGNPSTWVALADVIGRRQYDVAPLWPRQAPIWIQLANVVQYADWQAAMGWGRGVFTTPARVGATLAFIALGVVGWSAMRRDARRLADALAVLFICGTAGVCAYLNLKAGASLGYGFVSVHEARERDYFFVPGFWSWGLCAGYGATALARRRKWPASLALAIPAAMLVANFGVNNRREEPEAWAARTVALSLLNSAPHNALLFLAGDNDTYPIWYAQQAEGVRPDVTPVTLSLLPSNWYEAEIGRRTHLVWKEEPVAGARWQHEQRTALIAAAARLAGRPIAASTQLESHERGLLGADWVLAGSVYLARSARDTTRNTPSFPSRDASAGRADVPPRGERIRQPDDVSAMMLGSLDCHLLGNAGALPQARRDSLETRCNLR